MNYRIEPLVTDHFIELAPLMKNAFGNATDVEYFQWKYTRNPVGCAIGNVARASDGKLAAFYGLIPEAYFFSGEQRLVYQSCDTMTHSQHRRKGLFELLATATYRESLRADPKFFAMGFGGRNSTPGFLKMGWRNPFALRSYFKPKMFCWPSRLRGAGGAEISDVINEKIESIFQKRNEGLVNGIAVDPEYLRWRFSNPRRKYSYVYNSAAVCIINIHNGVIFINYAWGANSESLKFIGRHIDVLSTSLPNRGLLTYCQRGGGMEKIIRSWGFMWNDLGVGPASGKLPFITYSGAGAPPQMHTSHCWDLSPLDHDSA